MQFSIVSYLDKTSSLKVRALQQELSDTTGSVASLTSWQPHITLGDGVELNEVQLETFRHAVGQEISSVQPFKLELSGVSSLRNRPTGTNEVSTPYVIFLDVVIIPELLELVRIIDRLSSKLGKWYSMPRPYLPHITLAFRDLTQVGLEQGLSYLKGREIFIQTTLDNIALVEKLPNNDTERIRIPL